VIKNGFKVTVKGIVEHRMDVEDLIEQITEGDEEVREYLIKQILYLIENESKLKEFLISQPVGEGQSFTIPTLLKSLVDKHK
jgi:hypothetical protein